MISHLQEWLTQHNERRLMCGYCTEGSEWIAVARNEFGSVYKGAESKIGMQDALEKLYEDFNATDAENKSFTVWKCSCGEEILVIPISHFGHVIALPHCLKCDNTNVNDMTFVRRWSQEEIDELDRRLSAR